MTATNEKIAYIGDELELFKNAVNWKRYFSKKILHSIHGDVLEVGAGIGVNSVFLAKNTAQITSYTCVEPDEKLALLIQENIHAIAIEKKIVHNGTIKSVAYKKFDTIIYIDVLEHIAESRKEIELAKRCLKPNGRLLILVPAYNFLFSDFDTHIGHYRRYNKKILLRDINSELATVKLFYLDSMGFFASLANKVFLKKELPSRSNIHFWDNYLIPMSRFFDLFFLNLFGKSLVGIFEYPDERETEDKSSPWKQQK
ncbi:class I SAM-dependent methyltransferase [Spongiimicrobium salis]|uniref:class I SAM-dependent methyltransferase n=1 Tax=Spongiimicrobium salis TaxID=1667022 RepID=UPI00374CF280